MLVPLRQGDLVGRPDVVRGILVCRERCHWHLRRTRPTRPAGNFKRRMFRLRPSKPQPTFRRHRVIRLTIPSSIHGTVSYCVYRMRQTAVLLIRYHTTTPVSRQYLHARVLSVRVQLSSPGADLLHTCCSGHDRICQRSVSVRPHHE